MGDAFNFSMYNTQILLCYQYLCNVISNLMKSYYGRNFTTGRFWFGFLNLGAESNLCMWITVIHVCCVARFSRSAPGAEHMILLQRFFLTLQNSSRFPKIKLCCMAKVWTRKTLHPKKLPKLILGSIALQQRYAVNVVI